MLAICEHVGPVRRRRPSGRREPDPARRSSTPSGNTGVWSYRVTGTPPLLFKPNRYDSVDNYAIVRWQPSCDGPNGCYRRIEGFRPGR